MVGFLGDLQQIREDLRTSVNALIDELREQRRVVQELRETEERLIKAIEKSSGH
jgi:predicted DNA-binding ribbon-helix-helix protein